MVEGNQLTNLFTFSYRRLHLMPGFQKLSVVLVQSKIFRRPTQCLQIDLSRLFRSRTRQVLSQFVHLALHSGHLLRIAGLTAERRTLQAPILTSMSVYYGCTNPATHAAPMDMTRGRI